METALREVEALLEEHESVDAVLASFGVDPREAEEALSDWVVFTAAQFACRDADSEMSAEDQVGQYRAASNGLLAGLLLQRQSAGALSAPERR